VTELPLVVTPAFQKLTMVWPDGQVQVTVQAVIAELPAVTVTVLWKPPVQLLSMCQLAEQVLDPPVGGGVGLAVRGGVGLAVRGGVGLAVGGGVGLAVRGGVGLAVRGGVAVGGGVGLAVRGGVGLAVRGGVAVGGGVGLAVRGGVGLAVRGGVAVAGGVGLLVRGGVAVAGGGVGPPAAVQLRAGVTALPFNCMPKVVLPPAPRAPL